jgi:hypothetical protein
MSRLDEKLARIRAGQYRRRDFIIADAKDPDMGPGLHAVGPVRKADGAAPRLRTRAEFLGEVREIVKQDIVDIMLASASNIEALVEAGAFEGTGVKPAIRANDTTDVWRHRGAKHHETPSKPFRTASLARVRYGSAKPQAGGRVALTDLGLYSITFNNVTEADVASLEAFAAFRADAEANDFKYFLEVFNPNASAGLSDSDMPAFVNDSIVRCLAGLTRAERPQFLKIAYNGARALAELAEFDPDLVVGVLGGGAGTTRDCFELIHQAEKYGARVALFGRKINLAESPLDVVRFMRGVADGDIAPKEAVAAYHDTLGKAGIRPARTLAADSEITEAVLKAV